MIPLPTAADEAELLRDHLAALLCDARLDTTAAEAVAAAVTAYFDDQQLTLPLPDDYLHLLIYRALRTLNQNDTARLWAQTHHLGNGDVPIFDPEIWPGPVPLIVWQLFASRLVRPARTITAEGRILWALDFRRLRQEQAGWLEITLLPGLRALLEQLAPAWDESSGAGLLGLRGLYAAGFAPTPRRRRKKAKTYSAYAPLDAAAIRSFCLRVLANLQQPRGWATTPDVLYLDFSRKG